MSDQFIDKKELLDLKTAPLVAWPTAISVSGLLPTAPALYGQYQRTHNLFYGSTIRPIMLSPR